MSVRSGPRRPSRLVERRLADEAHDLGLELGERRVPLARSAAGAPPHGRNAATASDAASALTTAGPGRCAAFRSDPETAPWNCVSAYSPCRSMTRVSGTPVTPYGPQSDLPTERTTGYVSLCLRTKCAGVLGGIGLSTPTKTTPSSGTAARPLRSGRLLPARDAPRSPEVEHDHLARSDASSSFPRPSRRVSVKFFGCGGRAAPVHDLPDQEPEERRRRGRPPAPARQLRRAVISSEVTRSSGAPRTQSPDHAGTMITGVPTCTWSKSHSADGMNMRMQPCDAE